MEQSGLERHLAAILHGDVASYSRLIAADEDSTVRAVCALGEIVEGRVRQHRGRLVDFTGDAFLAEFPSAVDAVGAALAIQRECAALQASLPDDRRVRFRLGVHVGEVRAEGKVVHAGRRIATAEGRLTTADGRLLAHGVTTCMIFALSQGQ